MSTTQRPAIQPFTVTVVRNGQTYTFDVRGTHDMMHRLCERIDNGEGRWGREYGPLYYTSEGVPVNGDEPTQYDDRSGDVWTYALHFVRKYYDSERGYVEVPWVEVSEVLS